MKILTELTKDELINRLRRDDPKKYDRRRNYLQDIEPLKLYSAIFMAQGILVVPLRVGKYDVRIQISGVMKSIRMQLDQENKTLPDRNLVYRAIRKALDKNDIYVSCSCPDYCLPGDTEIQIFHNGILGNFKIADVNEMFNGGEDIASVSIDKDGAFVKGNIVDIWVPGQTIDLIEVCLTDDTVIKTTPNHPYIMRDGGEVCASELMVGDLLAPNSEVKTVKHIVLDAPIDVYDISVEDYHNFMTTAGVALHNCYREKYMATKFKYNFGEPENRPAKITNPNNKGSVCKHIAAALSIPSQWIKYVDSWISTVVRAYLEKKLQLSFEDIEELVPQEYVKDEIEDITDLGTPDKDGVVPMDDTTENNSNTSDVEISENEIEDGEDIG